MSAAAANDRVRDYWNASALGILVVERVFARLPPFVAARAVTLGLRTSGVRIGRATVFWGMPELVGTGD
ncbi:MAG TPA: hypothetical protein VK745_05445, partial [Polyangiaceae bacterium]|nr:hypothetical protein [Polyangiaceae bacterium]